METTELLKEEIDLLYDLSKDLSFDTTVLEDSRMLIDIKNRSIIDLGGTAITFDVKEQAGISETDLLDRITKQLSAIYPFRTSANIVAKYNTLNRIFKLKSGITFEEFKNNGSKFLYGGSVGNYTNNIISNLVKTNQFFFLRETKNDSVLKYRTPDNSVLFQVLLPNSNIAFAVIYPLEKNTIVDFYQDEELTQSLNLTYSFSAPFDYEMFTNEYNNMMKELFDTEKKYY